MEGACELNIAKHRSGSTGTVNLRFIKNYARFESLSEDFGGMGDYSQMAPNTNFDNPAGMSSVVTYPSSIDGGDIPSAQDGEAPFCRTRIIKSKV